MMALLAVVAAFFVGIAMKYGGLCIYAAALQIVREQRFERLMAFLAAAAAWATLLVVPQAWLRPAELQMSGTHHDWDMALIGGALLGLGAWLNRGRIFGTFVQLTGGNDGLLLSGIPVLAPHALVGYGTMLVSMLLLLALIPNDKGFSIGAGSPRR